MNASTLANTFWEREIYSRGRQLNRYPYDSVVSFLFRWRPREKQAGLTKVLEVGCGAGNNLWFAAREGFRVAGIDASPSAIAFARQRFENEGLEGDLEVGSFAELPWADASFDLAIDRCSLACASVEQQRIALAQLHRVLRPGGMLFHNGYSDRHTSARHGRLRADGRVGEIRRGTLVGVGDLTFCSRVDIQARFACGWEIASLQHVEAVDELEGDAGTHAEWRAVVRKC
jgi:SAM-dependent methyltransferase